MKICFQLLVKKRREGGGDAKRVLLAQTSVRISVFVQGGKKGENEPLRCGVVGERSHADEFEAARGEKGAHTEGMLSNNDPSGPVIPEEGGEKGEEGSRRACTPEVINWGEASHAYLNDNKRGEKVSPQREVCLSPPPNCEQKREGRPISSYNQPKGREKGEWNYDEDC